ncbi:hypothetical protein [Nostoc sp. NIES-3756]|uniref:hypothetical protein n=1 Tax=Nostoc sp. NIES-3756 TaxID=1751286 RepID=UPI000A480AB1|nr:hypothetical protein [Nostoc sp. NIES-3756]
MFSSVFLKNPLPEVLATQPSLQADLQPQIFRSHFVCQSFVVSCEIVRLGGFPN